MSVSIESFSIPEVYCRQERSSARLWPFRIISQLLTVCLQESLSFLTAPCPLEACMPSIWCHTHKPSAQHLSLGPQLERRSQAAGLAFSLPFPKQEPACSIMDIQLVISQDAWGIRDNSQDLVHSSRAVLMTVCFDITFISLHRLMPNANTTTTVLRRLPDMRRKEAHAKG